MAKFKKGNKPKRKKDTENQESVDESHDNDGLDTTPPNKRARLSSGFPTIDGYTSDAEIDTRALVQQQNRKKKKSGGFQSMGLSHAVFKGIMKKGYKIPTPIQRKCIPVIMEGRDVVGMARTGSGKTAAFLLPMLERLQRRSAQSGARALVLSPTRELALQTLKFTKELGRYTDLKAEVILGGDRMDDQFAALHENPDILIATPGRLLHVLMEMDLKLKNVEYVVFDEADRLFEMGFAEQLNEILSRLPDSRQTLLFSATLPKSLVEFASAGLSEPTLVRLDVESKISDQLKNIYLYTRSNDKTAVLLHLLREVIDPSQLTVVFLATRHHVQYVKELLDMAGISCTYIYSALDQAARKINVAKFANKKTRILLVTDIAARGIDIPMLDVVINYNFPGKPKLFVHRVGRVARAGRSGTAYSIIAPDELPYLIDLHLFLGKDIALVKKDSKISVEADGHLGRVPQSVVDEEESLLRNYHKRSTDLAALTRVVGNAMKHYLRSRPLPSTASVKRSKEIDPVDIAYHPLYGIQDSEQESTRVQLVDDIKQYKPHSTIFEINSTAKNIARGIMKSKRKLHGKVISKNMQRLEGKKLEEAGRVATATADNDENAEEAFSVVIGTSKKKKGKPEEHGTKQKTLPFTQSDVRDKDVFISYTAPDRQTEQGLSIESNFEKQAASAVLDFTQDESQDMRKQQQRLKWERKKKKFVGDGGKEGKKILTESGKYISASYKTNIYKEWLQRSKADARDNESDSEREDAEDGAGGRFGSITGNRRGRYGPKRGKGGRGNRHDDSSGDRGGERSRGRGGQRRGELRNLEQIMKQRKVKSRHKERSLPRGQRQGGKTGGRGDRGMGRGGSRSFSRGGRRRGGGGGGGRGRGGGGGGGRGRGRGKGR
ncbi:ATP-dependent RNA helicase DDX54-like [Diadema antillarum]|uniref:ATP-dependent RNA helicase DDX54-like n=1 Tax=Diadema antillarum TaxID=105358 RepID=UPI003A873C1D